MKVAVANLPRIKTLSQQDTFVPTFRYFLPTKATAMVLLTVFSTQVFGQTLLLKDGRKLEGKYAELASIEENPLSPKAPAGEVPVTPLLVVDDGLRRTYIHSFQVKQVLEDKAPRDVRINIWQPVAARGGA